MRFDAPLELLVWGRNSYVVIKIPTALEAEARSFSTRRVEGSIEGAARTVTVNVGVNRADVLLEAFVYVGRGLRDRLGSQAGDVVTCQLEPVDPDHVPVPPDVADALAASDVTAVFDRLTPSQRRQLLAPVEAAARPDTRARRIEALTASLPDR